MEYAVGKVGRIIAVRLFEGEDIYQEIEAVARAEKVESAAVLITGGLAQADVVVGPKEVKPKIVGDFRHFAGPGEVLGVGTLYCDDEGPKLHIHAAIGKGDEAMVGCPRGGAQTFLILEVTIIEMADMPARRETDADSGLKLLRVRGGNGD